MYRSVVHFNPSLFWVRTMTSIYFFWPVLLVLIGSRVLEPHLPLSRSQKYGVPKLFLLKCIAAGVQVSLKATVILTPVLIAAAAITLRGGDIELLSNPIVKEYGWLTLVVTAVLLLSFLFAPLFTKRRSRKSATSL